MAARLLDGKQIGKQIQDELRQEIAQLRALGITPGLAAVLVGENPASHIYVRNKIRACQELGLHSEQLLLPASTSTEELLAHVDTLNRRDAIDGILVQLPLPAQVDSQRVLLAVDPAKDVDGFHPVNVGNLVTQREALRPCTPAGILEILRRSGIVLAGSRAVVIGRSDIVGKPVALLLLHEHATVTLCHSRTRNLPGVAREADILVAALGRPAFVTPDFVRPGATVIDVGVNRIDDAASAEKIFARNPERLEEFRRKGSILVGDVHPDVAEVAGALTPVPGGVGPLTIAMLMVNTVKAARLRRASPNSVGGRAKSQAVVA